MIAPRARRLLTWLAVGAAGVALAGAAHLTAAAPDELEESVARMARIGSAYSPSFSPDGRRIAFVSDLTGTPQVWIVPAGGGWPDQVTALQDPVGSVIWSPDGEWLAFSMAPGGGMNQQVCLIRPDGTGRVRLTDGGRENNWLGDWSHDGSLLTLASNRRDAAAMDAYVYERAAGGLRLVAENPGVGYITRLSRDGAKALLYRMRSRGDSNLYLLDPASRRELLLTPHEGPGSFEGGAFSPTGDAAYLLSNAGREMSALGRVKLDTRGGPAPIEVIAGRDDAELQEFELDRSGSTAALLWNASGRNELSFLDLRSGRVTAGPALPSEIAGGLAFSPDGLRLAMTLSGSAAPADIWVLERESGNLTQVTRSPHAGVDLGSMVRPELARFPAHDGRELSGWLYRPKGARRAGPMVMSFHGGPEGQERPSFRREYQALLAQGIGVFAPNVRGSSGFGKTFVNLDNGPLRFDAIKDIESCVAYVVRSGAADPARIGIMGGSYGGYMTMAGLAEYPDLFAAGANLFGVVNFETFFAHTEPWMAAISTIEYGDPNTQPDLLRRLSPIHKLDRVSKPTIVLHGANDTNVPVVEAEQVVNSLRKRGVPVEYVLFADEGHGFRKEPNRVRSAVSIVRWFSRYLGGSAPGQAGAGATGA